MTPLRLDKAARLMGGSILSGAPDMILKGVHFDSRLIKPGYLFFALPGERDGHDFIPDAGENGAAAAVVSHPIPSPKPGFGLILVKDPLKALQELAGLILKEVGSRVVGITGSIGKTTTKAFAASMLSSRYSVLESQGNFNNHIGLPVSLLELIPGTEIAVLEMAMNSPGEIRELTRIAPPDCAVITNIHPVHLEFFSGIEAIASAKREILEGLKPDGTAVLNGDDPRVMEISDIWKGNRILFGLSPGCMVRAENIKRTSITGMQFDLLIKDRRTVTVPFLYSSYLFNFLAAAAAGTAMGLDLNDIVSRAEEMKPLPMRGRLQETAAGIRIIDDSYNSNPHAVRSALDDLKDFPAERRAAVLGDMLELGPRSREFHFQTGRDVVRSGWDILVAVGPMSAETAVGARSEGMPENQVHHFPDSETAAKNTAGMFRKDDLVLVKGSRGIRMDRIVREITRKGI